jgi:hypothetical protein
MSERRRQRGKRNGRIRVTATRQGTSPQCNALRRPRKRPVWLMWFKDLWLTKD